ncbi:hypothetical protein SEVIR_3G096950v4 [Setaria viridis]
MQRTCPLLRPRHTSTPWFGFENRHRESTDKNGGLPTTLVVLADRFPRPHPRRQKLFSRSIICTSSAFVSCSCTTLSSLCWCGCSSSAFSFFPGQIYQSPPSLAGAFWKFRRVAVLRLCSCPSRVVVVVLLIWRNSPPSLGKSSNKGEKSAAPRAQDQRYCCFKSPRAGDGLSLGRCSRQSVKERTHFFTRLATGSLQKNQRSDS